MNRVGLGFDLHPLVAGRPLVLGGVTVPSEVGLDGHSDADVLTHAVGEALLGALALGDLGRHFPDTDPQWRGASSLLLLGRVTTGPGGQIILDQARRVLQEEFPGLAGQVSFHMPDEKERRHGQAMAAASLPALTV